MIFAEKQIVRTYYALLFRSSHWSVLSKEQLKRDKLDFEHVSTGSDIRPHVKWAVSLVIVGMHGLKCSFYHL